MRCVDGVHGIVADVRCDEDDAAADATPGSNHEAEDGAEEARVVRQHEDEERAVLVEGVPLLELLQEAGADRAPVGRKRRQHPSVLGTLC